MVKKDVEHITVVALAKIGRLGLLRDLYDTVFIPPFVKVESVDRGKERGALDALEIEGAIDEGWIKVAKLTREQSAKIESLISETGIGLGEAGALTLARDEEMMVILDDKEARAIAKSWSLEYRGTLMVLYEAFVKKLIF
ncbi:MAG: hypothetical protein U9O89_01060 [Thermoproteota archaeon]|nr:hypothetical protein [Thermoproteota archaeon]